MPAFTAPEIEYLTAERRLGRVATVGRDGMPHVVPAGVAYNAEHDTIDVTGMELARTKKFRDARRNPSVAVVVDDVLPPWQPRGIEVRARAEAIGGEQPVLRLHPVRIVSWGFAGERIGEQTARDVA